MSSTLARTYTAMLAQAPPKKPTILGVPKIKKPTSVTLLPTARLGGFLILAPSGAGKSILTGKYIALSDVQHGIPQIILDVGGQCIENFLHALLFLNKDEQQAMLSRVVYCDMAGSQGYVTSWPLLCPRRANESLYHTAIRLPELLGQLDVNFANATIQGLSRTIPIATMSGILLTALDLPITFVFDLLRHPELWIGQIAQLENTSPEVQAAVEDFYDYLALNKKTRDERTEPFLNRLNLLRHNTVAKAMFGSTRAPTIDFEKVARTGQTVLIDFSRERSPFDRHFTLLFVFSTLLEYIETRRRGERPLSILIDELAHFVRGAAHVNTTVIAERFRYFVEQKMRNANTYVTVATQDLKQIPPEMLTACLNMKSLLLGAQADPKTATYLAERFIELDPMQVKYWERVWGSEKLGAFTEYFVLDHRPIFAPLEKQRYTASRQFMKIQKGTWLFAQSPGKGLPATDVRRIRTPHLFDGPFASDNPKLLQKLRSYLTGKVGIPFGQALAEIDAKVENTYPAVPAGASPPQPIARHIAPVRVPRRTSPVRSPGRSPVVDEEDRPVLPDRPGRQEDLLPAVSKNGSAAKESEPEWEKTPIGTLLAHNGQRTGGRRVGELPIDDED